MKKLTIGILIASAMAVTACTDAMQSKIGSYGDQARITCYSGGVLVFDDFSTGKVNSEENSDGWYFRSVTTQRAISAGGDCRIDYGAKQPSNWKPTGVGDNIVGQ